MAKKKQPNTSDEFILVNVIYEDGSQRSNRKIPSSELSGFDDDADRLLIGVPCKQSAELVINRCLYVVIH